MEYVPIWERDKLEEGLKIGKKEGKLETARNLLRLGIDIDIIARSTGFSKKKIEQLKKSGLALNR